MRTQKSEEASDKHTGTFLLALFFSRCCLVQFRVQVSSLRPRGTLRWPSAAFRSEPCSEQSRVSCDSDGATSILSCINGCVNCSQLDEICLPGYSGRVTLNVQEKPNLGKNDENKQCNYRSLHPARQELFPDIFPRPAIRFR